MGRVLDLRDWEFSIIVPKSILKKLVYLVAGLGVIMVIGSSLMILKDLGGQGYNPFRGILVVYALPYLVAGALMCGTPGLIWLVRACRKNRRLKHRVVFSLVVCAALVCVVIYSVKYEVRGLSYGPRATGANYRVFAFVGSRDIRFRPFVVQTFHAKMLQGLPHPDFEVTMGNTTLNISELEPKTLLKDGWESKRPDQEPLNTTYFKRLPSGTTCEIEFVQGRPNRVFIHTYTDSETPEVAIRGIPGSSGDTVTLPATRRKILEVLGEPK